MSQSYEAVHSGADSWLEGRQSSYSRGFALSPAWAEVSLQKLQAEATPLSSMGVKCLEKMFVCSNRGRYCDDDYNLSVRQLFWKLIQAKVFSLESQSAKRKAPHFLGCAKSWKVFHPSFTCSFLCAFAVLWIWFPLHASPLQRNRTGTVAVLGGRDFKGWIIYCRRKLMENDPAPQSFSFIHRLPFNFLPWVEAAGGPTRSKQMLAPLGL